MISPIPRFFGSSDSLDYANCWHNPHAEPPSHSDRKSCSTRCEISSPAKELGITFRTGIGISYVTTIRNRHSETVDRALIFIRPGVGTASRPQFRIGTSTRSVNGRIRRFPVWRPNSSPGARSRAADAISYGHRFAQTGITFRSVIGIAYKTPIRNRHSEALDAPLLPQVIRRCFGVEKPSFRNMKLRFEPMISPIPGFFGSSDSLDYANRWRIPHTKPPSHSDRKSCSTRREISSPRRRGYGCPNIADIDTPLWFIPTPLAKELGITFRTGIGIAYVTTIRNRHSETVDRALVSRNSVPGPKSPPGACVLVHRLSYPPVGRRYLFARGSEPPAWPEFRIDTSTRLVNGRIRRFPVRCPNSSPGARSRAADAIAYGHRFAQTGITFRSVIGIAYKTPIRNRHSEALDAPLLPQRLPRLRESLAEPTRGAAQSQRSEVVFNSMRDLLPRSWIRVLEHRRYSHPLRFIPTPSAKELGITLRTGIGIAYVTTIRNRHSETVDRALVSRNSFPGPKFPPGACVLVHRLTYPPVGRGYLFARESELPARPQFRIGTSTRSVNGRIQRFPVRRPNSSPGERSRAADAIAYGHRFAQTSKTFCSIIGIAYKTPIWNRHSEALDAPL
ncbi:hypothetical protein Taro_056135 [Colocasia esculenta]|uniref:Uncharacterized protein n=1 Tax=Colocasia esculenta TaxID=4460 RepID=A0A843XT47_COLES|nr:hypothetical protein [Colocasia esculenta]